jgi:hypothetical protein
MPCSKRKILLLALADHMLYMVTGYCCSFQVCRHAIVLSGPLSYSIIEPFKSIYAVESVGIMQKTPPDAVIYVHDS